MKGHWTKEKPTKPGWFKAIRYDYDVEFVEVDQGDRLFASTVTDHDCLILEKFTWWWSEPEELPELPKEEGEE